MTVIRTLAGDLRVEVLDQDGHHGVLLARGDGRGTRAVVVPACHLPAVVAALQEAMATLATRPAPAPGRRWMQP